MNRLAVAKAWGLQQPLFRRDSIHVDEIDVSSGGYCSVHRHDRKHNLFQVLYGSLTVLTFSDDLRLIRTDQLEVAGHCLVRAGWLHQFWSRGGCIAQEVYYGTQDGNLRVCEQDIYRVPDFALGGRALTLDAVPSLLETVHA